MTEHRPLSDQELILFYYGEHPQAELAERIANDPALTQRLNALADDLEAIEAAQSACDEDQLRARRLWHRISPSLDAASSPGADRAAAARAPSSRAPLWLAAAAVLALSVLISSLMPSLRPSPGDTPREVAQSEPARADVLVNRVVDAHLQETERLLITLVNQPDALTLNESELNSLLDRNRLYRQLAAQRGRDDIRQLLFELEPLLLDLANDSRPGPSFNDDWTTQHPESLLFRVRLMDQQLNRTGGPSNAI